MSERIRELIKSMGIVPEDEHYDVADLMVQKCIDLLIKEANDWEQFSRNPPPGQENNASAAMFAACRLKEDAVWALREYFEIKK